MYMHKERVDTEEIHVRGLHIHACTCTCMLVVTGLLLVQTCSFSSITSLALGYFSLKILCVASRSIKISGLERSGLHVQVKWVHG